MTHSRFASVSLLISFALAACGESAVQPATEGPATNGTGGEGNVPAQREICDGSDDLRFAVSAGTTGGLVDGQGVALELGLEYILVSGRCEFFVWDRTPVWKSLRRGTLSEADSRELARDFEYETWPSNRGFSDSSLYRFYGGQGDTSCAERCDGSAPPEIAPLIEHVSPWVKRLQAEGVDADGAIRLRIFEGENVGPEPDWVDWPLADAPDAYLDPSVEPWHLHGAAHLVTDATELSLLRALRPALSAGTPPEEVAQVKGNSDGRRFYFVFRDVTPFEDASGQIPGLTDQ